MFNTKCPTLPVLADTLCCKVGVAACILLPALIVACAPAMAVEPSVGDGVSVEAARTAPEEISVAQLKKAAGQGDAEAQTALGLMYEQGRNVARDYKKALMWYRKAAKQGNAQALYNLGRIHETALGETQDMAKAVQRYADAAKLGNADAQRRLSQMFEAGESAARNNKDAAEWYRQKTERAQQEAEAKAQEEARQEAETRAREAAAKAEAEARAKTDPASGMPLFSIYEYTVDGNSLLSDLAVENAVSTFMGDGKTLRDVESARAALERAYHDAGYLTVVVSIPEQNVDSGAVALHVVEAGIDRLKVKGAEYALPSVIKSRVPELAEGKVPNFNTMQTELTALNRGADVKVTPVLRAGKEPGTVEVQLDVEDQLAVHGSVEFSNRQTPNTTPERLSASLRYDNLWQRGHSFGLTMQIAPERLSDARVLAGTYVMPVDSAGDSLTLYGVHSRSQFASLADAPGLGLLGNTDTLGTRFSLPLGSTADYSQTFAVGVDYKDLKQTLVAGGIGTDSPITYAPLVATYTGNLFGQNRSTTLDVTATSGLRGLFGNNDAAFNAKRSGASANFLSLHTGLQHTENLSRWALYGKLEMQLSSGPLVPTEQFLAGGAESVRGYLEGELAGDSGVRATVELRTPSSSFGSQGSSWRMSGLAFFDTAWLSIRQPVPPQPETQRISGTGFGLRLAAPHGLTVDLDAAHALLAGDITRAGENRVLARALWAF